MGMVSSESLVVAFARKSCILGPRKVRVRFYTRYAQGPRKVYGNTVNYSARKVRVRFFMRRFFLTSVSEVSPQTS